MGSTWSDEGVCVSVVGATPAYPGPVRALVKVNLSEKC